MEIKLSYVDWKNNVQAKKLRHFSYFSDGKYNLIAIDSPIYFTHKLDVDSNADYEQNYLPYANKKSEKLDSEGYPVSVAIEAKSDLPSFPMSTHDFCNKVTWYTNSVRVIDEILSTGDGITYAAANDYFIDVTNGLTPRQNLYAVSHGVVVKVDDVIVTSGFTIDHVAGEIVFDSVQVGTVKCTYSYATDSKWKLVPDSGKVLNINKSEIQFATDVQVTVPLVFEVTIANPYVAIEGHPYFGIPRLSAKKVQYNNMRDFVNEANLGQGYIPQIGDLPTNIIVFPFNYISNQPIQSSYGAELIISSLNDVELTGSYGTATFYLTSRSE